MKQSITKNIARIRLGVYFDNGTYAIVTSPQKNVKVGIRTRIGWWIALIGLCVIFGEPKNFRTIYNPLFPEPPEGVKRE